MATMAFYPTEESPLSECDYVDSILEDPFLITADENKCTKEGTLGGFSISCHA